MIRLAATSGARAPRYYLDPVIAVCAGALLMLGLVMMTSASVAVADRASSTPLYFLQRQGIFLLLGLVAAGVVVLLPTRWWQSLGFVSLLLALALLIVVLVPGVGHTVNGSTRWIALGPVNLQASEAARLLLMIYLCGYIVRHQDDVRTSFAGFARPMLFVLLAATLLLAEPDFGAATVLTAVSLGVMFIAGVRIRDLSVIFALAFTALAALAFSSPYRLRRIVSFLDPWSDPYGSGFQLSQSLIAIGRGDGFGVGLGGSVQKLFYLPEAHTDFVFAVLAEEFGLAGVLLTLGLFLTLLWRGFQTARRAALVGLMFQSYLAYALVIWLGLQSFINIGVNLGVLPTKGLTLPLLSYGGSSLMVSVVAIGLLLRIYHETNVALATPIKTGAQK